jgi:hypothetical protein
MVHALKEIWRVLLPGGFLLDLRPFVERWPIEVVSDGDAAPAGLVDDTVGFPDSLAADDSIDHMVESGLFTREQAGLFELFIYWDTVAVFKAYMDERSTAVLPPETLARATHLESQYGSDSRVRARINMIIARYRKLAAG